MLAENLTPSDKDFLLEGMRMNQAAGLVGVTDSPGLGYGASVVRLIERGDLADDSAGRATAMAGAAVDARMSGLPVPVMASGSSGNLGIGATVPIAELGRRLEADDDRLARALATSHLVVAYIKHRTGSLSALCGAYAAAAPGAAAGVIRLLGGEEGAIGRAIGIIVGNVSGVICDGAKAGCAVKVGTAAGLAVRAAYQAMRGVEVPGGDGVVADTPEGSVDNLARVAKAMRAADATILDVATSHVNHGILAG
jgi:L-cysteine desulfidase